MADVNEKSHAHTTSDSENFSTADTRTPSLTTSTKDEISSKDSQQISSATHHKQHEFSELPADYDLQITNPEDLERDAPDTITHTKSRTSIFSRRSSKKPKEGLVHDSLPLTNLEEGIVGWDSQDDPAMPLNFPVSRKFGLMGLVAVMTFVAPLASSMFAPGVGYMAADFHNTNVLLDSFVVSVFLLGFAFGPLVLSPMSEIFGRRPVLDVANAFFVVWQIGCALAPNLGSLIAFRFLAGLGGSGCITLGSGVISDLFYPDQRGAASAIYALGPLIGPVVGPVCGGFIAQRIGWRWVFWIILIASAPVTIAISVFNRETNHQVLIRRKTERLSKELGRTDLRSCYTPKDAPAQTPSQIISQGLVRPFKMLFKSPIVFILALYMSFVYGLLYLLFTTITQVFQETYHWPVDICGLAFLGVGIGFFLGIAVVGKTSDKSVIAQTKKNNGVFVPEMRLPSMMVFAFFVPISFFWYGWSADKHTFWIVPIIGMVPFGFGMMGIFVPIQTYIIDCFPMYAASGNAALTATRSLVGGLLPLAGPTMYDKLGLGWGNSLLGFLAIAMIPVPALIYKYGGAVRTKYPVNL